ncbi:hypothetical protein [Bradyrhizobium japonicum]|nr:hypothetical protein [Bradyrhizobium japonicum]
MALHQIAQQRVAVGAFLIGLGPGAPLVAAVGVEDEVDVVFGFGNN